RRQRSWPLSLCRRSPQIRRSPRPRRRAQVMDRDTDQSIVTFHRFSDLKIHPWPQGRVCADEHDRHRCAIELLENLSSDRLSTPLLLFVQRMIVETSDVCATDDVGHADLVGAPGIVEVKTKKDPT